MSEEEKYKANYMQKPFDILTKENLDRLEKHCKKAIHYERGNIREEHQIVLQLIYEYQNSVSKAILRKKINERQFELQQEYKDFEDDIRLNTLQEIYYLNEEE